MSLQQFTNFLAAMFCFGLSGIFFGLGLRALWENLKP